MKKQPPINAEQQVLIKATETGDYPPNTTAQTLMNCKNHMGDSILHWAAQDGKFPPNTTAENLAQSKNNKGHSALHNAVNSGHFLPDITPKLLKTTTNNEGKTAWESMINAALNNPIEALKFPPALFQDDHETAIEITKAAIAENHQLTNAATLWLGRALTKPHPQTTPQHKK